MAVNTQHENMAQEKCVGKYNQVNILIRPTV